MSSQRILIFLRSSLPLPLFKFRVKETHRPPICFWLYFSISPIERQELSAGRQLHLALGVSPAAVGVSLARDPLFLALCVSSPAENVEKTQRNGGIKPQTRQFSHLSHFSNYLHCSVTFKLKKLINIHFWYFRFSRLVDRIFC